MAQEAVCGALPGYLNAFQGLSAGMFATAGAGVGLSSINDAAAAYPAQAWGALSCQPAAQAPAFDSLSSRLAVVALGIATRCGPTLGVTQVWRSLLGPNLESLAKIGSTETALMPVYQVPYMHDDRLLGFMQACRTQGIIGTELGSIAQVWSKGALQVVQHVPSISSDCHPRTKLQDCAGTVAEVVYIPVYEQYSPLPHVVAVLEVLVAVGSRDSMVVANVISLASELLSQVKLSISRPKPMMVPQQATPAPGAAATGPSASNTSSCSSAAGSLGSSNQGSSNSTGTRLGRIPSGFRRSESIRTLRSLGSA